MGAILDAIRGDEEEEEVEEVQEAVEACSVENPNWATIDKCGTSAPAIAPLTAYEYNGTCNAQWQGSDGALIDVAYTVGPTGSLSCNQFDLNRDTFDGRCDPSSLPQNFVQNAVDAGCMASGSIVTQASVHSDKCLITSVDMYGQSGTQGFTSLVEPITCDRPVDSEDPQPVKFRGCDSLDENVCNTIDECRWMSSAPKTCKGDGTDKDSCNAIPGCTWTDKNGGRCKGTSTDTGAATCQQIDCLKALPETMPATNGEAYYLSKCNKLNVCRYLGSDGPEDNPHKREHCVDNDMSTSCDLFKTKNACIAQRSELGCAWTGDDLGCVDTAAFASCEQVTDKSGCNSIIACNYDDNLQECVNRGSTECSDYSSKGQAVCNRVPQCMFDPGDDTCKDKSVLESCIAGGWSEEGCATAHNGTCAFVDGECRNRADLQCEDFTGKDNCQATSGCFWTGEACKDDADVQCADIGKKGVKASGFPADPAPSLKKATGYMDYDMAELCVSKPECFVNFYDRKCKPKDEITCDRMEVADSFKGKGFDEYGEKWCKGEYGGKSPNKVKDIRESKGGYPEKLRKCGFTGDGRCKDEKDVISVDTRYTQYSNLDSDWLFKRRDTGRGNHDMSCDRQGLKSFQGKLNGNATQIRFEYKCQKGGFIKSDTTKTNKSTDWKRHQARESGSNYSWQASTLTPHNVQCDNKPITRYHIVDDMKEPGSFRIEYACANTERLTNCTEHTSIRDDKFKSNDNSEGKYHVVAGLNNWWDGASTSNGGPNVGNGGGASDGEHGPQAVACKGDKVLTSIYHENRSYYTSPNPQSNSDKFRYRWTCCEPA